MYLFLATNNRKKLGLECYVARLRSLLKVGIHHIYKHYTKTLTNIVTNGAQKRFGIKQDAFISPTLLQT